jgi:hypothetical protein
MTRVTTRVLDVIHGDVLRCAAASGEVDAVGEFAAGAFGETG